MVDCDEVIYRHVSRISLREGPQLRGAPRLGGPEARDPKVPFIKKEKSADLVHYFLDGARLSFIFLFSYLILSYFTAQDGALVPVRAPPPWIRPR